MFGFPYDNMRAAAKLEDGEAVVGEYRAQADGLEPTLGSGDIGCRKPDMAYRHRRPLINSLRHDSLVRLSARARHCEEPAGRRGNLRPGSCSVAEIASLRSQ
jgi:hypothetical protein